ncbi:hypothetical protein LCGC14_2124180 [marine sediment metagenome]|uniref:L,D-TPase catalytic domain-containing protein n=1 Tax=marine sediment metagenome TaxID=412755 RepID=A0A0F9E3E8_9ZZZZ
MLLQSCGVKRENIVNAKQLVQIHNANLIGVESPSGAKISFPKYVTVERNISISEYFGFMDSVVERYDSIVPYQLSEHLLLRANPWVIDVLANTDYYRNIERDTFIYDQKQSIVLRKTDSLIFPEYIDASRILNTMNKTWIDINIPEFKLRIFQDSTLLYTFPIRVGQSRERFLVMGNRITDMRTITGKGKVIRVETNPTFYNPVDGKQFFTTKRDDEKRTLMPLIPWIETEINGIRNGQMIHPTTNPKTLGKAYSNGCIGVKEADAWLIYYYAPTGTPITIRYDLKVIDSEGKEIILKDIY